MKIKNYEIFELKDVEIRFRRKGPPEKFPLKTMKVNESFFIPAETEKTSMRNLTVNAYRANERLKPKRFIATQKYQIDNKRGVLITRVV